MNVFVFLEIDDPQRSNMKILPYIQSRPRKGAYLVTRKAEMKFRNEIEQRSQAILDEKFMDRQWDIFCKKMEQH